MPINRRIRGVRSPLSNNVVIGRMTPGLGPAQEIPLTGVGSVMAAITGAAQQGLGQPGPQGPQGNPGPPGAPGTGGSGVLTVTVVTATTDVYMSA